MNRDEVKIKLEAYKQLLADKAAEHLEYKNNIDMLEKQLEDLDKPEITTVLAAKVERAVEQGVGSFDFSDDENYDKEFGINYDGRVVLEHFDFVNSCELVTMITQEVLSLFKEQVLNEENIADNS